MGKIIRIMVGSLLLGGALALFIVHSSTSSLSLSDLRDFPLSSSVSDRGGRLLWVGLAEDEQYSLPVSLDRMGKWLPLVAVQVEDRRFYDHKGIDWQGLVRATFQNIREGRIVSGGSTITSQLVRLTCPRPRTFKTKCVEFAQARSVERMLSKDEILELYLNRASFGGNIRGVRAASLAWWSKEPSDLSLAESVILVAMLKGPTRYRPDLHPRRIRMRRNMIIKTLVERGVVDRSVGVLAVGEPLPLKMAGIPGEDYLFVQQVLKRYPDRRSITSSLDRSVQSVLARVVSSALAGYSDSITAAAVVVDNLSGSIRGYVGNGRFGKSSIWGWVDCCDSPRSPGSALKPFVYSMAFDDGLLSPSSLIADTPLSLSGQAPRNFDLRYRGPVSVADALSASLNVPAVRTLRMVGGNRFLQRLAKLGFMGIGKDAEHYGDSLILGGCEVTLLELVGAYTVYSSGKMRELSFVEGENPGLVEPIYSEGACYLTSESLRNGKRGEFASKTGTSYGFRDAWTAGWNRDWTVAVWLGDPEGASHTELVGMTAATPIVRDIMGYLGGRWFKRPDSVVVRDVCSLSGLPPVSACSSLKKGFAIKGVSPSSLCPMHKWEAGKIVVVWPPELALSEGGKVELSAPLTITSPLEGVSYMIPPWGDVPRISLVCEGAQEDVSWFVDGVFLKTSPTERNVFWSLISGAHRISIIDKRGRTDYVDLVVTDLKKKN